MGFNSAFKGLRKSDTHSNCSAAQACSWRPLAENRPVQSQDSPCGICGKKKSGTGTRVLRISDFSCHYYHFNNALRPISFMRHGGYVSFAVYSVVKYNATPLSLSLSLSIYIYIYIYLCTVCIIFPFTISKKLTHCGRVTQICVFNTVKLGTSTSSP